METLSKALGHPHQILFKFFEFFGCGSLAELCMPGTDASAKAAGGAAGNRSRRGLSDSRAKK
jgi:hypothetical protein